MFIWIVVKAKVPSLMVKRQKPSLLQMSLLVSKTNFSVHRDHKFAATDESKNNEPAEGIDVLNDVILPLLAKMKAHKRFWEAEK
ncbi:MAG: hypothetical protein QE263_09570 [Vampirovibrionales bacterium]|nr:hypothetical protein [Vampirovibrionales bacterium]